MPDHDPKAWQRFLALLHTNPEQSEDYDRFRVEVEEIFNFSLDRTKLDPEKFGILKRLFDRVVWYSPLPEERAEIPNYISEAEMKAAIENARHELGIEVEER